MKASRNYTAYKDGQIVRNGTFTDEHMLRNDLPAPEYELVLDELHYPEEQSPGYQQQRLVAYPSPGELADAIYWQSKGDNSKMEAYLAKVDAVKDRIPKV